MFSPPGCTLSKNSVSWFIGSQALGSLQCVTGQLTLYETASQEVPRGPILLPRTEKLIELPPAEPLRRECEAFLKSIQTRQQPVTDARSGYARWPF